MTHRSLDLVPGIAEREGHLGRIHVREHALQERRLACGAAATQSISGLQQIQDAFQPSLAVRGNMQHCTSVDHGPDV